MKPRATFDQLERISNLQKKVSRVDYRKCLQRFYVKTSFSQHQATKVIECLETYVPETDTIQDMSDALERIRKVTRKK